MSSNELKNAGLKVTLPRLKILDILAGASEKEIHLTAEELYKQLNDSGEEVGLATVYRVLTQFEQAGLVKRHFFDGGQSIFELDIGDHHDHIICLNCGHIDEFTHEGIHAKSLEVAKKLKYELKESKVTLYGICHKCQTV